MNAKAVIVQAFTQLGSMRKITYEDFVHQKGHYHYHARPEGQEHQGGAFGGVDGVRVHSYSLEKPPEEPLDKNNSYKTYCYNNQGYYNNKRRKIVV